MTTRYRVFLYSSDIGRLTFEEEFDTREEAETCVGNWCGDRDPAEEALVGNWEIQERKNAHLKGSYRAYAHAYPNIERPPEVEGESIEDFNARSIKFQMEVQKGSKQIIHKGDFVAIETAQLAIDEAVHEFALDLDIRLAGRIQREQRAAGIHERFITDLKPFGYKVYRGERGPIFQYSEETTIDDLKALVFPEGGLLSMTKPRGFDVKSGALRVTDPCYDMEVWCAGTAENVLNGRWLAQIQYYQEPVESYTLERLEKEIAELENPEETERFKALKETLASITALEEKEKTETTLEQMKKFHFQQDMREFSRCWGNPDDWTGRVAYLHIRHESVMNEPIDPFAFVKAEMHVGVDSGQAGFFDLEAFKLVAQLPNHAADKIPNHPHKAFYETCGEQTLGADAWGVVQGMGCVSSSGYGDGSYSLLERRNEAGELIEARIVYMIEGSELFPCLGQDEEDEE